MIVKGWATTKTGKTFHAFTETGKTMCGRNYAAAGELVTEAEASNQRSAKGTWPCQRCATLISVRGGEAQMAEDHEFKMLAQESAALVRETGMTERDALAVTEAERAGVKVGDRFTGDAAVGGQGRYVQVKRIDASVMSGKTVVYYDILEADGTPVPGVSGSSQTLAKFLREFQAAGSALRHWRYQVTLRTLDTDKPLAPLLGDLYLPAHMTQPEALAQAEALADQVPNSYVSASCAAEVTR